MEVYTGMGMARKSRQFRGKSAPELGQMLRECCEDGIGSCGNPARVEFVSVGSPRGHLRNLANDENSAASVRILGELSCEMSYVAAKRN